MTEPLTHHEHVATRQAFQRPQRHVLRARANWELALEHVQAHPGITVAELARLLADDKRCTWSSVDKKLHYGRNVDGAMGRSGIRSELVGRVVRLWAKEQV